MNEVLVSGMY